MLRKIGGLLKILLVGAVLPFAAAPAFAADYCITQSGGVVSDIYVGKDFTPPKAGECKTWQGLCKGCSPDNVQIGVACTASNGSHFSLGITTYYLAGNRQFDWIRLDLPSQTGSGNFNYQNPALGTTNYTATGAACATQPVR